MSQYRITRKGLAAQIPEMFLDSDGVTRWDNGHIVDFDVLVEEGYYEIIADSDKKLLEGLARAERANGSAPSCQVCGALEKMSDQAKEAVERAVSGTIGTRRLAQILTSNGYQVGDRAVVWHRSGHTKRKPQ